MGKGGRVGPTLCRMHGLELGYFCKVCAVWICADCGVIGSEHRGHEIVSRGEALRCSKDQLVSELAKIKDSILRIGSKKEKCVLDLEVYRAEFKWSKARLQKYCD